MSSQVTQTSPTMARVLQEAIKNKQLDLHTCLPGIVKSVDPVKKCVDVTLSIKRKFKKIDSPIVVQLFNVPLGSMQSKDAIISVPVAVDDDITVFFIERSIDNWKNTNDSDSLANRVQSPDDFRMHHFSDAIAIPLVKPYSTGIAYDPDNILIQNDKGVMKVSPTGKFSLSNGTDEVISLLKDLADECAAIITNTSIGPQPPTNVANFTALATQINNLKL